jgi:16S rRNA (adenine1518-N6/adenine1519-N6)-dimethyltransferase
VVGLQPDDAAVEIGPGLGDLTRAIAGTARRTVALEVDRGLVALLREEGLPESVELRHADALRTDLGSLARELGPPVALLGNLPYSIAGRLLGSLLHTRRYGVLSVWASLWTQSRVGLELGPEVFEPRPRVRSTLVVFEPVAGPPIENVPLLRRLVREAFQRRRKMLRAALRGIDSGIDEAMRAAEIDPTRRPEALAPEEWVRLANALATRSGGS